MFFQYGVIPGSSQTKVRSLVMGRRGLVLSTKVDWLASIRWNCPPRPPRGQVGTPPNRTAEKVCGQPGNYVIRALPAAPSPPELAEKIHCYRGSTRHAYLLPGGGPGRSHSSSFDHRRRPETLRTAMATAFF
jgi:hypothetical protein